MKPPKAVLLLQDGTTFEGAPFGAPGEAVGEAVFYTGVVGYQEVLTDPSYGGTLAVLTYPIIGSYGVNAEDNESPATHPLGVVVKGYSPYYSNFRATGALEDFLVEHAIVGIQGVDTRAVAVHLRDHGEMKALIASGEGDPDELLARLKAAPSPFESDLVRALPCTQAAAAQGATHKLAILDLGVTRSLLGQLADLGCAVSILPPTASADEVLAVGAEGLLAAGGPGDPRVATYATETLKALLGQLPILGVGLGHQLLALALGCRIARLPCGHHGLNYPVRDLARQRCDITAQHHSFVVVKGSMPDMVEVTHANVNDGTVEGLRSTQWAARSVQFHPSRDPMGRPSIELEEFVRPS